MSVDAVAHIDIAVAASGAPRKVVTAEDILEMLQKREDESWRFDFWRRAFFFGFKRTADLLHLS